MKRYLIVFAGLALSVASAETFHVTLFQPTVVQGKELKAGDYKMDLQNNQLTIARGKEKVEVPVTVEKANKNFGTTAVRYTEEQGKYSIREIEFGGSKTKVVIGAGTAAGGGR